MKPDIIYQRFLAAQYDDATQLAAQSDILDLKPLEGRPPCRYLAFFHARGLVQTADGEVHEANGAMFGIWFPESYLVEANPARVLTYLGPHRVPWHPNIRPPYICAHVRPGTPLTRILHVLFELWSWALFATGDEGLNHAAAQWARHQPPGRFPVDRRPLKRRIRAMTVHVRENQGGRHDHRMG